MRLVDKIEAGMILSVTPSIAEKILKEWKVQALDTGRGRGRGLRWSEDDIQKEINSRLTKISDTQCNHKKTKPAPCISGRAIKDILADVA